VPEPKSDFLGFHFLFLEANSFLDSLTLIDPFLASISIMSPLRSSAKGPPRAASGPT